MAWWPTFQIGWLAQSWIALPWWTTRRWTWPAAPPGPEAFQPSRCSKSKPALISWCGGWPGGADHPCQEEPQRLWSRTSPRCSTPVAGSVLQDLDSGVIFLDPLDFSQQARTSSPIYPCLSYSALKLLSVADWETWLSFQPANSMGHAFSWPALILNRTPRQIDAEVDGDQDFDL